MITAGGTGSHLAIPQVVKVFTTRQRPDHNNPWRSGWIETSGGSGVFVGPGEILTNAHVVAHATHLQVQKMAEPDKAIAEVKATCHDTDLALLTVKDERFLRGTTPVPIGELPERRDKVVVAGYPVGGDQVSITEGVVSRIEAQSYSHSSLRLLAVTIDAAINAGNSGGPVFREGKVVGIAFQKRWDTEGQGVMVPAPLLRRFLDAVARGKDSRIPGHGLWRQNIANPTLRRHLGLRDDESGVLVTRVEYGSSTWGLVQKGDVLLTIDGLPIGSDGTVPYRGRYRTDLDVIRGDHLIGDEIELLVLRGGERKHLRVELKLLTQMVENYRYERPSTYFIYAGLIFQPLTLDFLGTWGDEWWKTAPARLTLFLQDRWPTEERRQVVVLNTVLAHRINVGYEDSFSAVVAAVNGQAPRDMADFVRLVEGAGALCEIELGNGQRLVFDTDEVRRATPDLLERYQVVRDRSADLLTAHP